MCATQLTAGRLKQTALAMFAESGYDGVTMAELAKAVGIKTPSIYAHFTSKESLFETLFEEAAQVDTEHYAAYLDGIGEGASCETLLHGTFRYFTEEKQTSGQAFLKKMMLMPPRHMKERLQEDFLRYEERVGDRIGRILTAGMDAGDLPRRDPKPLLALFFVMIDGLLVEQRLYNRELYRERQQMAWAAFWKAAAGG